MRRTLPTGVNGSKVHSTMRHVSRRPPGLLYTTHSLLTVTSPWEVSEASKNVVSASSGCHAARRVRRRPGSLTVPRTASYCSRSSCKTSSCPRSRRSCPNELQQVPATKPLPRGRPTRRAKRRPAKTQRPQRGLLGGGTSDCNSSATMSDSSGPPNRAQNSRQPAPVETMEELPSVTCHRGGSTLGGWKSTVRSCVHQTWPPSSTVRQRPAKLASLISPWKTPPPSSSGTPTSTKRPPEACKRMGPSPLVYSSTTVPGGLSRCTKLQVPANRRESERSLRGACMEFRSVGSHTRVDGHRACPCSMSTAAAAVSESSGISSISVPKAERTRAPTPVTSSANSVPRDAAAPGGAGALRPTLAFAGRPTLNAHHPMVGSTSSAPSRSASSSGGGRRFRGTQAVAAPGSCTTAQNRPVLAASLTQAGTPRSRRRSAIVSGRASMQAGPTGG
mmetsp:Transcript_59994/g.186098  ORF Transcript_59994/g.186098 Transcript_59994/m.186098 type:complete len:447 (-) Transcript_59994:143-1483(-)